MLVCPLYHKYFYIFIILLCFSLISEDSHVSWGSGPSSHTPSVIFLDPDTIQPGLFFITTLERSIKPFCSKNLYGYKISTDIIWGANSFIVQLHGIIRQIYECTMAHILHTRTKIDSIKENYWQSSYFVFSKENNKELCFEQIQ